MFQIKDSVDIELGHITYDFPYLEEMAQQNLLPTDGDEDAGELDLFFKSNPSFEKNLSTEKLLIRTKEDNRHVNRLGRYR